MFPKTNRPNESTYTKTNLILVVCCLPVFFVLNIDIPDVFKDLSVLADKFALYLVTGMHLR